MEEDQLSELLELLEPAAQPVTSRKGKCRAPAEEEDQQLEPSRARKGNSDGQWRGQEKYGLTPNMMALYEWASTPTPSLTSPMLRPSWRGGQQPPPGAATVARTRVLWGGGVGRAARG